MPTIVYIYDEFTFEYLGPQEAQDSPLEPGTPLLPSFATEIEPPAHNERQAAVFHPDLNSWSLEPDFRGVSLFSTADGKPVIVTVIGPQPAGTTTQPRPSTDHVWSADGWVISEEAVQRRIAALRTSCLSEIDAEAGRTRGKHITVSPGQDGVYQLKLEQATQFSDSGYQGTVPELVQAEADAMGDNAAAACMRIQGKAGEWASKAAQIELVRRRGKIAVSAAADASAIELARDEAVAALKAL